MASSCTSSLCTRPYHMQEYDSKTGGKTLPSCGRRSSLSGALPGASQPWTCWRELSAACPPPQSLHQQHFARQASAITQGKVLLKEMYRLGCGTRADVCLPQSGHRHQSFGPGRKTETSRAQNKDPIHPRFTVGLFIFDVILFSLLLVPLSQGADQELRGCRLIAPTALEVDPGIILSARAIKRDPTQQIGLLECRRESVQDKTHHAL